MHEPLRITLDEIQRLLEVERVALRSLDLPAIENAAAEKLKLELRLKEVAARHRLDDEDRAAVSRVREAALANQLLLVHARACVRGALAIATGDTPSAPYSQATTSAPGPLRVNLRG